MPGNPAFATDGEIVSIPKCLIRAVSFLLRQITPVPPKSGFITPVPLIFDVITPVPSTHQCNYCRTPPQG